MSLKPEDYKNLKLDKDTRSQLFELFVEKELAEMRKDIKRLNATTANIEQQGYGKQFTTIAESYIKLEKKVNDILKKLEEEKETQNIAKQTFEKSSLLDWIKSKI